MPVGLSAAAITGIAAAGGTAAAGIYAANKTSGASEYGANLQSTAAQQALDFQKQQAALDARNNAAAQLASYQQYAGRQQDLSTLGQAFGLAPRTIPAPPSYLTTEASPSYDPFTATGGTTPPGFVPATQTTPLASSGMPAASSTTNAALANPQAWMSLVSNPAALKGWVQQSLGAAAQSNPGLADYYVSEIQSKPGANPTEQAGSANYWAQRMMSDPNVTGSAPAATPNAVPATNVGTAASLLTPTAYLNPLTPALQMPGVGG